MKMKENEPHRAGIICCSAEPNADRGNY